MNLAVLVPELPVEMLTAMGEKLDGKGKPRGKRDSWEAMALDHVSVNKDLFGGQRWVERKTCRAIPKLSGSFSQTW